MSDVYIISACPKCGGMPIVIQLEELAIIGRVAYGIICEDCHTCGCATAHSPKQAIEEWEAYCKRQTRSREDAGTSRID